MIWNLVELISICASRDHRGTHPSARVTVDLIIWLVCAAAAGWLGYRLTPLAAECNHGCQPDVGNLLAAEQALISFVCALLSVFTSLAAPTLPFPF